MYIDSHTESSTLVITNPEEPHMASLPKASPETTTQYLKTISHRSATAAFLRWQAWLPIGILRWCLFFE